MYNMLRFSFSDNSIHVAVIETTTWFRGKDVAMFLEYANTQQALIYNVDVDDTEIERDNRGQFK